MDFMCTQTGAATAVLRMGKALRVAQRVVIMIPCKLGAMVLLGRMMFIKEIYLPFMSMGQATQSIQY